jgi:hypothetical protein
MLFQKIVAKNKMKIGARKRDRLRIPCWNDQLTTFLIKKIGIRKEEISSKIKDPKEVAISLKILQSRGNGTYFLGSKLSP